MHCHCVSNNRAPWWTFTDPCKPEVRPGAREEFVFLIHTRSDIVTTICLPHNCEIVNKYYGVWTCFLRKQLHHWEVSFFLFSAWSPESDLICSGRGECICGMCVCGAISSNSFRRFTGQFCECNDYTCPYSHNYMCGGKYIRYLLIIIFLLFIHGYPIFWNFSVNT